MTGSMEEKAARNAKEDIKPYTLETAYERLRTEILALETFLDGIGHATVSVRINEDETLEYAQGVKKAWHLFMCFGQEESSVLLANASKSQQLRAIKKLPELVRGVRVQLDAELQEIGDGIVLLRKLRGV